MASDFPLTVQQVLPVIDVFARTSTHLEHVSRFLQTKLPPGFPIAFSVPIVPSVSAKVWSVPRVARTAVAVLLLCGWKLASLTRPCLAALFQVSFDNVEIRTISAERVQLPPGLTDCTKVFLAGRFFDTMGNAPKKE